MKPCRRQLLLASNEMCFLAINNRTRRENGISVAIAVPWLPCVALSTLESAAGSALSRSYLHHLAALLFRSPRASEGVQTIDLNVQRCNDAILMFEASATSSCATVPNHHLCEFLRH